MLPKWQDFRPPPPAWAHEPNLFHVSGDSDRLASVHERASDERFDPVSGVGTEAGVHRRVEALNGAEQAEIALFNQIFKIQSVADVAAGDVDDQAEVGPHHPLARFVVAVLDAVDELLFFLGVEQGRLVNLAEICL